MSEQLKNLAFDIAAGASATTKKWKNEKTTWAKLVKKLSSPVVTKERYKDFLKMSKEDQSKAKDVGGFVGGYLRGGKRSPQSVQYRQLLTLDLDFAPANFIDTVEMFFDYAAFIHTTHKHGPELSRYRLIVPVDRPLAAEEYEAVARKVADSLNIEYFDRTTYQVNRLMFWPSVASDGVFECRELDGKLLGADKILAQYLDWTDSTLWPTSAEEFKSVNTLAKKQEDPTTKNGLIGAFCRAYDIDGAISTFLSDSYEACAIPNRYTYRLGSTSAGLIVYEGKFAYSHHGTDPTSGHLCNAFDLVRLHLYGHMDDSSYSKASAAPSFKEMEKLVKADKMVISQLVEDRLNAARYEFAGTEEPEQEPSEETEEEEDWKPLLQVDRNGVIQSSAQNINLILEKDSHLKGIFGYNIFDYKRYVLRPTPWTRSAPVKGAPESVEDVDYSGLRNYLEVHYGISASGKIDDAAALVFARNCFHPIRAYLDSLAWDGKKRIDTLLIDYLGAEDNIYTREAIRKTLVAAVARIYEPGIKYDLVLTLVGPQGKGKSTFIRKLAKTKWFSDSLSTVQGKEAYEQLQGVWLIEIAELAALRKHEAEAVKQFISKQSDTFRPAYGRTIQTFKRQCVFFGSVNPDEFLKDPTGNRRWMPIDVNPTRAKKDVLFSDTLEKEVDQIWAEAVALYLLGEPLYLGVEASHIAAGEQVAHSESDDRRGVILDYLDTPLPKNWDSLDVFSRCLYLDGDDQKGEEKRRFVCAAEVWVECLRMDKSGLNARNTREINDIMRTITGWTRSKSTKRFKNYGIQKYYERD